MGVVYQLTFLFGLVLLAIFVTVFVFAVSLLGRAMEAAATVERSKVEERKQNNIKEMSNIRKEIKKAETKGEIPKGLRQKLEKLEERNREFDSELSKIRKTPELLTVKGGVIYPCIFIILGLILSGTASYLSTIKDISVVIPLFIWILGLSALGYSIYRLCKSLKVIEDVAVTSEEAWISKTVEAFKIAQKEIEIERKPLLVLAFEDEKPPFHVKAGEQITIQFGLYFEHGELARKLETFFFAPVGFDFPNRSTWMQGKTVTKVGGYITTSFELGDCNIGVSPGRLLTIKAPPNKDSFSIKYKIICQGFESDIEEFDIIVE